MGTLKRKVILKQEGITLDSATPEMVLDKWLQIYPHLKKYVRGNKKSSTKKEGAKG